MSGKLSNAFNEMDTILSRLESEFRINKKLKGAKIKKIILNEVGEPLKVYLDSNIIISDDFKDDSNYEFIGDTAGEMGYYFFGGMCDVYISLLRFETIKE